MGTLGEEPADLALIFSCCAEHYYAGRPVEGVHLAAVGVHAARKKGDKVWLRKLLTAQGVLEADLHNLPQAFAAFSEAVELCHEIQDPEATHGVWNNISCALIYAELPDLAISAAKLADEYAARIAVESTRNVRRGIALSNVSYGFLLARRYGPGLRAAEAGLEHFELHGRNASAKFPEALENLVILMTHKTRLLLRVNILDQAQRWAARAASLSATGCGRRVSPIVDMTSALCDVYVGKFEQGVKRLRELASTAGPATTPVLIADALRDLCEAHLVVKRSDIASEYMRDLAKHMHLVRSESALFHHRRHLGWLSAIRPRPGSASRTLIRASEGPTYLPSAREIDRNQVLKDLCAAAELYDDPSGMHPHRVGELASLLTARATRDSLLARRVGNAARLHDIGKIGIPPAILGKRGSLGEPEAEIMRSHADAGADILASATIEDQDIAVAAARHHHEWWSGTGYPSNLAGEAIPLPARVTAIAEAFDAMTHDRPYRPRLSVEFALGIIAERAGRQFDPKLTCIFADVVREIQSTHGDIDSFLQRNAHKSPFVWAQRRLTEELASVKL